MGEIEQICNRISVIQNGRLVAEGPIEELRGGTKVLVRADPMDKARRLAEAMYGIEQVQVSDGALLLASDPNRSAEITRELVTSGVDVSELRPVERSLEETFLELTSKEH
jgi:ABC-2 type transport system ATP-binding protein